MDQAINKIYKRLFTNNKRYTILLGGRASGRSYTASQFILSNLIAPDYFRCAMMRFVKGDIKNSINQEIQDRIDEAGISDSIEQSTLYFKYGKNSVEGIGFRKSSSDQKSKLKSLAGFNCIIIEEADEVSEEDFLMLDDSIRKANTDIKIILLLNPPHKNHWIIRKWFNLIDSGVDGFFKVELKKLAQKNTDYIFGTYLENIDNLNQTTIDNYENYKNTNRDHYYNMIKGFVSEGARGRIFKNWKPMTTKEFDDLPYKKEYGLDFGYSNDPTALLEIKRHNNKIYVNELLYKRGLTNQAISRELELLGISKSAEIIADREPKSIEELVIEGWNVIGADKGPGSVRTGVNYLLAREIYYTESSANLALESQNYKWALDRNKLPTNEPIDDWNHAIDSLRYCVVRKTTFVGFI